MRRQVFTCWHFPHMHCPFARHAPYSIFKEPADLMLGPQISPQSQTYPVARCPNYFGSISDDDFSVATQPVILPRRRSRVKPFAGVPPNHLPPRVTPICRVTVSKVTSAALYQANPRLSTYFSTGHPLRGGGMYACAFVYNGRTAILTSQR